MWEAQQAKPRLLATVSGYGTHEYIHSAKVTYQWTSGRIVFERVYHQLSSGNLDDWTTDIVEESVRLGRNIPLVLQDEPFEDEQCPGCHKGLSNIFDRGYGLRSVAPNWDRESSRKYLCKSRINRQLRLILPWKGALSFPVASIGRESICIFT